MAHTMHTNGQAHHERLTHVSDEAWQAVEPLLQKYDPPRRLGRKRIDQRQALDAIVYRLQSGCRWNNLPKEYPDDSSVHRTYQRWQKLGVMEQILQTLNESATERPNLQ